MSDLAKVQQIELDMLQIIHKLFEDNNLTYYAVGGTLLGAVRHEGFIPWDDDIDLAMPRPDYEKFVNTVSKLLPHNLTLKKNPLNLDILQVVNTDTLIQLGTQIQGIFIDIFPIDGVPDSANSRKWFGNKVLIRRMLCKISVLDILEQRDRGTLENLITSFSNVLKLNKIINTENQLKKLDNLVQRYSYNDSNYVGVVLGRYRNREFMDKEIWGVPQKIKFESIEINAPSKYKSYLSNIYGDYMVLPPKEKRVAHNIKLLKS